MQLFKSKAEIKAEIPTELPFKRSQIRKIMNHTGWGAYESYCHALDILQMHKGATIDTILDEKLWLEYISMNADNLASRGRYLRSKVKPPLDEAHFNELFYSKRQRRAIKKILRGQLTLKVLAAFFRFDLPESLADRADEDISNRLKTTVNSVTKDSVFFCESKKYLNSERLADNPPMVIIGYKRHQETFADLDVPFIACNSLGSYVIDLAALWLKRFDAVRIGISGSIGKTTTTDMIGKVVGDSMNMFKIYGNQNTTWQIARFVYLLNPETEAYVQEASGSYRSQLEFSSRALHPNYYVLTNIGHGHIGNFEGKQSQLLYEKLSLDRHSEPDAVGIINSDDPLLKKQHYNHSVKSYAIDNRSADFHARNIVEKDGVINFDIYEKSRKAATPAVLNVCGVHNVYNALAAFAVGVQLGIDRSSIVKSLASFRTEGVRQNLMWLNGRHLYLDCYSATVESMETGMKAMQNISVPEGGRKIAILGDIPSLEYSERDHRAVGRMTTEVKSADEVIFYGTEMEYAFLEASGLGLKCRSIKDRLELEEYIMKETCSKDLILFKASHKCALQWVLDDLFGTDFYLRDELTAYAPFKYIDNFKYKCVEEYGCGLVFAPEEIDSVVLPESVGDLPVRIVGEAVFRESQVKTVSLPSSLTGISKYAFSACSNLSSIDLSSSLKYIGPHAFSNCTSLEHIVIPEGCETIKESAFSGCTALKTVALPASVRTIDESAFDADTSAEFICPEGSYAMDWVLSHKLKTTGNS